MTQGYRDRERFWIVLTIRLAFGFMFLIAALNIFTYWDSKSPDPEMPRIEHLSKSISGFAEDLSTPYANTWLNFKWSTWPAEYDEQNNAYISMELGMVLVKGFLYAMPFVFTILGFCLLSGVAIFPAMRFSALFLVLLGLGKYVTGDADTTAQDFLFASLILVALYMTAGNRDSRLAEGSIEIH